MDKTYIWVERWDEFQTYQTKRGKPWAPPWLQNHTRQLDDERYLDLTAAERGLLHDLRLEFARTRLELRSDTTRLSRRLGYKVYTRQLERLNHAGFIRICSRTVLEQLRNAFWNGSSLEVEVEEKREDVEENSPSSVSELRPSSNVVEPPEPDNIFSANGDEAHAVAHYPAEGRRT